MQFLNNNEQALWACIINFAIIMHWKNWLLVARENPLDTFLLRQEEISLQEENSSCCKRNESIGFGGWGKRFSLLLQEGNHLASPTKSSCGKEVIFQCNGVINQLSRKSIERILQIKQSTESIQTFQNVIYFVFQVTLSSQNCFDL